MRFVRRISKIDELAAALPDEVKQANGMMSGPDVEDPSFQASQSVDKNAGKKARIEAIEKAGLDSMNIDWNEKKPTPMPEIQAEQARNNPANLEKRIFNYQKRRDYGEAGKQLVKGTTLGWNEEDARIEKEIEEKYANKRWPNWDE